MPNIWAGGAAISDDMRHTYERVFYDRQITGDLTANDVPGMNQETAPQAGQAPEAGVGAGIHGAAVEAPSKSFYGPEPSLQERQATATAYTHATPGVRAEIDSIEGRPYRHGDAPDLQPRGNSFGPENGPQPATQPSNDMTPG